ncbi:MAG: hypothetical protein ACYCTB_10905 [bacterium]
MFKKFKKITAFIGIMTVSMYLTLSIANTRNAYAFMIPSISGIVNAAGALGQAGEAMSQAGNVIGLAIPPIGPFGLASSVNQFLSGKFKSMMNMGKVMVSMSKLETSLAKVQSAINAATNVVSDVYTAENDITGAQNSLLSNGLMNNCSGGSGVMGSIASLNCSENTINGNISALSGNYSNLNTQAGIAGNGISGVFAGTSANQTALNSGVNNFSTISENGLGGSVAISPTSNLCQDELASGMVTSASQCTESYSSAVSSSLNKNLLTTGTQGIAAGNSEVVTGSGFSNAISGVSGSYSLQQVELLKLLAEEQSQNLKATGALTQQIAAANQAKAAKAINNSAVPQIAAPSNPIQEMQANGMYY